MGSMQIRICLVGRGGNNFRAAVFCLLDVLFILADCLLEVGSAHADARRAHGRKLNLVAVDHPQILISGRRPLLE